MLRKAGSYAIAFILLLYIGVFGTILRIGGLNEKEAVQTSLKALDQITGECS